MAVEVESLYAALGARVDSRSWAQADAVMRNAQTRLSGLTGALAKYNGSFVDQSGRWRAATGHLMTMRDKAQLAAGGVSQVSRAADAAGSKIERAGRRGAGAFNGLAASAKAVAGYLAAKLGYEKLIGFNATVEDTKIQLAGMMAVAKKTNLSDEVATADKLFESLQRRAASLPGSTQEYVQMAGKIARVVTDAGGSVKDLEDLTVNAVVAGKGLGEQWEVVARDIEQALMGRYNTTDPFLSKVLPSIGYKGEEGRDKWRALSEKKRFEELRRALLQKQFTQLGEAQGKTFSGRLSQFKDMLAINLGKIGKPLFDGLKGVLESINTWLDQNKEKVERFAATVGGVLARAFDVARDIVGPVVDLLLKLAENSDFVEAAVIGVGAAILAFTGALAGMALAATWPFIAVGAAITGIILLVKWIIRNLPALRAGFRVVFGPLIDGAKTVIGYLKQIADTAAGLPAKIGTFFTDTLPNAIKGAFKAAFDYLANLPVVKQVIWAIEKASKAGWLRNVAMGGGGVFGDAVNAAGARMSAPALPASASPSSSAGPSAWQVAVGGITVTSTKADPKEVAVEVEKSFSSMFQKHLGAELRRTGDET